MVAVAAALAAGSVALLGFGVDSFVESTSGAILIWRLRAEATGKHGHAAIESIEHRARRWVGVSLFALSAWIAYDAVTSLWGGERPDASVVGITLTAPAAALVIAVLVVREGREAWKGKDCC